MPVPTVIADLSTTAASNSPSGSEPPGPDGDNHIRALAAFIAQLRDGTTTVAAGMVKSSGTALSAAVAGTDYLAPAAIGVTVQAYDADIPTVAASQAEMEAGTESALRSMSPLRVAQAIAALGTAKQSVISYTGTSGVTAEGAAYSFSGSIPLDNTKPQITEGAPCLDVTITPSAAGVVIEVESLIQFGGNGTGTPTLIAALFKDSDADALKTGSYVAGASANDAGQVKILHRHTAASTSAITFKVRVGAGGSAATQYVNRTSANATLFGETGTSYIKATEV